MKRVVRRLPYLFVVLIVLLIVEFPHGLIRPNTSSSQQPVAAFHWAQYSQNMANLLHGLITFSLGRTLSTGDPIPPLILKTAWQSIALMSLAMLFVLIIGISKGIYDGLQSSRKSTGFVVSTSIQWVLEALPSFFIIISCVTLSFWVQARYHTQIYLIGATSFWAGVVFPAVILALAPIFTMSRYVRNAVEAQCGQPYLVTAYAKGLSQFKVIIRHLLPNCLATVRMVLVPVLASVFSGLILIEYLLYQHGLMFGLFDAMGNDGAAPSYGRPYLQQSIFYSDFNNFDRNLVLGYLIALVIVFFLFYFFVRGMLLLLGDRSVANPYGSILRDSAEANGRDWRGLVGISMIALLVLAAILANHLGLPSPNKIDAIHISGDQMTTPPFPPSPGHLLGTDADGRDLLSRALHFTLPTFYYVGLTALITVAAGAVLGTLSSVAGWRWVRLVVNTWNGWVTVMPGLLGSLLILEIPTVYFAGLRMLPNGNSFYWGPVRSVIVLLVLGVLECGKVAFTVQHVMDDALSKSYMEAAVIVGNSRWSAFRLHLHRTLTESVIEQVLVEFNQILVLIAVLGYFQLNLRPAWEKIGWGTWIFTDTSHDLGGLFSQNAHDFLSAPWVLLAPALFVAWSVFSLNLILESIHRRLNTMPRRSYARQTQAIGDGTSISSARASID